MVQDGMDTMFPRGGVFTLTAMLLLLMVAAPLAVYWLQRTPATVPDCAAVAVIQRLRQESGVRVPLHHIHSVGIDHRLGHRICSARVGQGAAALQLKYAVYFSAADGEVVLVLD